MLAERIVRVEHFEYGAFFLEVVLDEELLILEDGIKVAPGNNAILQNVEKRVSVLLWQQGSATGKFVNEGETYR
jgi:hypothetical protein